MTPRYCLTCREEDLNEAPMRDRCDLCGDTACQDHDRCFGCGHVICLACNTISPFGAPFAFVGDRWFHPHVEPEPRP